jgi:hypothetical protein
MARIRIDDLPQPEEESELSDEDLENVAGGLTFPSQVVTSSPSSTLYLGTSSYVPFGTQSSVFSPRG